MFSDFSLILNEIANGKILSREESYFIFDCILSDQLSDVQVAAFLMALRMRYWQPQEVEGAVLAMRNKMLAIETVDEKTVDVCGTGGDGHNTLNISTAVSFVLAALGVPVAKHGNRAQSSQSGGVDVLAALGLPPETDIAVLQQNLIDHKLAFLPAFVHHPALKTVNSIRKQLGFRTIFNLLGPMTNPAKVKRQLIGVFDPEWMEPMVNVLSNLGSQCVWAVHGHILGDKTHQGVDEITLAGPTTIVALEKKSILHLVLTMEHLEDAGFNYSPLSTITGGNAKENAKALLALLHGQKGPYRDTVILNTSVALHIAGYDSLLNSNKEIDSDKLRQISMKVAEVIDKGEAFSILQSVQEAVRKK